MNKVRSRWKAYLIDLDGTLYHGNRMIEGADALINGLKQAEIPYLFVTNNSSRTPVEVAERLTAMGIAANADEVCTSAVAAAEYVAGEQPGCRVAFIGEQGLAKALRDAGLTLVDEDPEVVVQGIDLSFTYDKLASAAGWIRNGAKYVLTNPDLLLPSTHGLMPGAGTISAAIRAASGSDPIVIGKPSGILMKHAIDRLGLRNEEVAVIGDNMLTDISAGVNAGCGTMLVLTGVTTDANLQSFVASAGVHPDVVCGDLREALNTICGVENIE